MKKTSVFILAILSTVVLLFGTKTVSAFIWGGEPIMNNCYHTDVPTGETLFIGLVLDGESCTTLPEQNSHAKAEVDYQHATGCESNGGQCLAALKEHDPYSPECRFSTIKAPHPGAGGN